MVRFALPLVRPYWKWLLIVLGAMLVETAMSLASPWPLKIVLDSVFGSEPMPPAFGWLAGANANRLARLNVAVVSTIVIALLQAASAYLNAYYTVSIGQWIAHDLRHSVYAHLQRLSMSVLRQAAGGTAHQHDHGRHQRRAGVHVDLAARHPD